MYQDDFPERIVHQFKRMLFLCLFIRTWHFIGRLDIVSLATPIDHKIHFQIFSHTLPIHYLPCFHSSHIDQIPAHPQFIVYDVLHQMPVVYPPEIKHCVPDSRIDEIVFVFRTYITPSFDVIT